MLLKSLNHDLRIIAVALVSLSALFITAAQADIYISGEQRPNTPSNQAKNNFKCGDRIYGVVAGNWPNKSKHVLEAYWVDPQGKQREHSRYRFTASQGKTRTWVWLQLHPGEADIVDRLLMQENESTRQFNGKWKVSFYIDGKKKKELSFNVSCE